MPDVVTFVEQAWATATAYVALSITVVAGLTLILVLLIIRSIVRMTFDKAVTAGVRKVSITTKQGSVGIDIGPPAQVELALIDAGLVLPHVVVVPVYAQPAELRASVESAYALSRYESLLTTRSWSPALPASSTASYGLLQDEPQVRTRASRETNGRSSKRTRYP